MFGFMGDDFVESLIRLESCLPGSALGVVDMVCNECGQTSTHRPNTNGSNKYVCPTFGTTVVV